MKTEDDACIEAIARRQAHGLIQSYLGPDHKVINMPNFYSALVQALIAARKQGREDDPGSSDGEQ